VTRHETAPGRLYQLSKRAAAWDPDTLDFSADVSHWAGLTEAERELLVRLTALFYAGEEGMTRDAAPLVVAVTREGRDEERRFLGRLLDDSSPAAMAEAVVGYSIISEGVLSETGHHVYAAGMRHRGLMPGLLDGLAHVRRDEARHMTYGVYVLSRLVASDDGVWVVIERSMNDLLAMSLTIVTEFFEPYDVVPFGLTLQDIVSYAMSRFARRSARVERARHGGVAMVEAAGDPAAELLEWVAERVGPLPVLRQEGETGALTLEVRHEHRPAALSIAPEVLDHFLAEEIVGALEESAVPNRLADEPGVRLLCLEGGGRIVVR
jgi:ribonucleoside-diphosphate reductase beta chain